jgi:hypothetical protein
MLLPVTVAEFLLHKYKKRGPSQDRPLSVLLLSGNTEVGVLVRKLSQLIPLS